MSWDALKKRLRRFSEDAAPVRDETGADGCPHPNDVDRKRIERALARRERYRYVSPCVRPVTGGYRIESPCCSRNIDPDGGVVDIALLQYVPGTRAWQLYRRDHAGRHWRLYGSYAALTAVLDVLNTDPERQFWQ
jgi:hypothetical protein